MKITFQTEKVDRYGDEYEIHSVLVDGKEYIRQHESIEPEDVRFYRDLTSPHDCASIIKLVIEAVKRGEEVELEYTDVDDSFGLTV